MKRRRKKPSDYRVHAYDTPEVDVSTLGTLTRIWWPEANPEAFPSNHRATPDVSASIESLRRYRRLLWPTRWPE